MKNKIIYISAFSFFNILILFSQQQRDSIFNYSFIIKDSPARLFTMRQVDQNYLSLYRLLSKEVFQKIENKKMSAILQVLTTGIFFIPLTHEEGHRSILTGKNIGAISQPFWNKRGAAYVIGVRDTQLISLRNTDLPNYIRLHTVGLESDYILTKRVEKICAYDEDEYNSVKWEYLLRKINLISYYLTGLFNVKMDAEEESDELNRDIVGHDIYGATRNLFRPRMEFYRYTSFDDLTEQEKSFVKRAGMRSLLNVVNPLLLGIRNFNLAEKIKFSFGLGYSLSPFGDFFDENIWINIDHKYKVSTYGRQFQNNIKTFWAFGVGLNEMELFNNIYGNFLLHYWSQPKNLSFFEEQSFSGGALEIELRYYCLSNLSDCLKAISIDVGTIYKSKGFLPEEICLDKSFGFRIGTSLLLK